MLIVSWNVAGWKATVEYITTYYGSLANYLDRMHVDVLCLQEVKLQRDVAFGTANAKGAGTIKSEGVLTAQTYGAHLPGWDSFWSFSTSKRGWQGVTTFAKKGLTSSADAAPLKDEALDAEGRCVKTDHGAFVLFNVYVHATDDSLKKHFLDRLQAAMETERAKGRRCVLAGDLNIAAAGADVPWKQASIPHSVISVDTSKLHELLLQDNFAREREAIEECYKCKDRVVVWKLLNALQLLPKDQQSEKRRREIERVLELTAHTHGESAQNEFVEWLRNLRSGDVGSGRMVDSFRAARPDARARFTCWNQSENGRYINNGRRIDYILYDASLADTVLEGPALTGDETPNGALMAATTDREWRPAAHTGAEHDVQERTQRVHDMQFVKPHTGIVYTPPPASDHVAVSLLLKSGAIPDQKLELDDATKACSSRPPQTLYACWRASASASAPASSPAVAPASAPAVAPAAAPEAEAASSHPAPPVAKALGPFHSFSRKGGAAHETAKRRRTGDATATTSDIIVLDGDE